MTQHKINVTLKAGAGYDAPWVTIGGDSEAEAALNLRSITGTNTPDFFALVTEAATALKGFYTASAHLGGTVVAQEPQASNGFTPQQAQAVQQYQHIATQPAQQQAAPQQPVQQSGPPGPAPICQHGPMEFVNPKTKPWKAWFCPLPQGADGKCKPQFIND